MLHDSGNNNVFAIANRINLSFYTLKIFINKDRMILSISVDDIHELFNLFIRKSYLHTLSAKNIGRSYKHRISKPISNFLGFFCCVNCSTLSTLYLCLLENLIEDFSVFCCVNILGICSINLNAHLH